MELLTDLPSYGSVCSGIEAATVAWKPLGLTPKWLSEIDPFANAVLTHHYPQVPNLGDMTQIAHRVREGTVNAPDILVGGTPCQSFSIAGARRGLADPRGALTLKYVELANAIDKSRIAHQKPAAIIVWENVPGVLNDRSNAFGCFLGAICGERRPLRPAGARWTHAGCVSGPERTIAWRVLDAQYFGLAQRRKRVFVVASARVGFDPVKVLFESEGLRRDTSPSAQARQDAAADVASGTACDLISEASGAPGRSPDSEAPVVCFGGGNASGPIERAACLTARGHKCDFEVETFAVQSFSGELTHALNAANNGKGSREDGTGRGVPIIGVPRSMTGHVSHPLTTACSVTEDGNGRGLPIVSLEYSVSESSARGFAFAQNSRGEVRLEGGRGERIGALSRGGGKPGQGQPVIAQPPNRQLESGLSISAHLQCTGLRNGTNSAWWQQWRVRRLMPVECERLQGFPDDYTRVPYRGGWAADGPRYKAIGNSMAVPCLTWIGRRLLLAMHRAAS